MQSVTDETISLNSVVRGFIIGGSAYEANSASRARHYRKHQCDD